MKTKEQILDELRDISPTLYQYRPGSPYAAPKGYFDQLPAEVQARVLADLILPATVAPDFRVPEGYFEGLAGSILEKVRKTQMASGTEDELAEMPLLRSLSRENLYTVPQEYFTELQFTAPVKERGKLVALRPARKWLQYATAAVVAGLLITSAFLFTDNGLRNKPNPTDVSAGLQELSDEDLAGYLFTPETATASLVDVADVRQQINALSDEELSNYLSENRDAEMAISVTN